MAAFSVAFFAALSAAFTLARPSSSSRSSSLTGRAARSRGGGEGDLPRLSDPAERRSSMLAGAAAAMARSDRPASVVMVGTSLTTWSSSPAGGAGGEEGVAATPPAEGQEEGSCPKAATAAKDPGVAREAVAGGCSTLLRGLSVGKSRWIWIRTERGDPPEVRGDLSEMLTPPACALHVNSCPPETRARKCTADAGARREPEGMEERVGGRHPSVAKKERISQVSAPPGWTLATHCTPMLAPPLALRKSKRPSAAWGESARGPQASAEIWRR